MNFTDRRKVPKTRRFPKPRQQLFWHGKEQFIVISAVQGHVEWIGSLATEAPGDPAGNIYLRNLRLK